MFRKQAKWPKYVLAIDCETTIRVSQNLIFGCARFCELQPKRGYRCIQELLFHADDVPVTDPTGFEILREYGLRNKPDVSAGDDELKVVNRSEFIEEYFWRTLLDLQGMVVCFNAPFDLSRLAVDCREARKRNEGWSFVMSEDTDPDTGQKRPSPFRPWVKVKPKDSKSAFIRLSGVGIRSKALGSG